MKRNFILLLLFYVHTFSFSQTWVQKLNDYYGPEASYLHPNDQVTGVKDMAVDMNGDIFVLAKLDVDSRQKVFKISAISGAITFEIPVGQYSLLTGSYCTRIKATSDGGFLLIHNYWSEVNCTYTHGELEKYSNAGVLQWSGNYTSYPCFDFKIFDATERLNGGYWALMQGITYKLDANGNMIDSVNISGEKLYEMPNGDLIVQSNTVYRTDTLGNVLWWIPNGGNDEISVSPILPYFYLTSGQSVKKISAGNGSIIWTKNYSFGTFTVIDITVDGGFEAGIGKTPSDFFFSNGSHVDSHILRADSAGDTLWTRVFDFPEYGISSLKCLPNGSTIFGSGFLIAAAEYQFDLDYRALCGALDSGGHGDIEHTSYMWPGDANNNQLMSFVDDALDIMIANGYTGPPRIIPDQVYNCCENFGKTSDFELDWNTNYANGINHKNADFDGSGLVDTNDVIRLAALWGSGFGFPDSIIIPSPFRFQNSTTESSTIPEFRLVAEHDTIAPDSLLKFYILAGSQGNAVDSIYGLAFSFSSTNSYIAPVTILLSDCDLGTRGTNLFTTSFASGFGTRSFGMSCRYDQQNATNFFDTLGIITIHASPLIATTTNFQLHIDEFKALRYDESIITFNLFDGSAVVDPGNVSVKENADSYLKVYPNPANDIISVLTSNNSQKHIEILNSTGQKVKTINTSEKSLSISTQELPQGIYHVSVASQKYISHFSVAVQH